MKPFYVGDYAYVDLHVHENGHARRSSPIMFMLMYMNILRERIVVIPR